MSHPSISSGAVVLSRDTNQAIGLARYAKDFIAGRLGEPTEAVWRRLELFHADSVACGVAALATGCRAPWILREEAMEYRLDRATAGRSEQSGAGRSSDAGASSHAGASDGHRGSWPDGGATCFASNVLVQPEKAVAAGCSAVRELDANGTNFGYNPALGHTRGEFGHNDFYPVAVAAAQLAGLDGRGALRAMLLVDELRGRLAEVFALRDYKIDHVVHGAVASAATFGATLGASEQQIESAIGLIVAHYIPFRAIRAGHQLSDSKGASAALSAEAAVLSMRRAMRGFVGPRDVFRNPQAIFCLFEKPARADESPFDLSLGGGGDDFSVMGMHFKLGLYEHQSAGAIGGLFDLLEAHPALLEDEAGIRRVRISIYEPAFSIIGDPAKRDPRTRQSADHSMVYIVATLLRKAFERRRVKGAHPGGGLSLWRELMLLPEDYDDDALRHPLTRSLMERIEFLHGGPEYDRRYPEGIPTRLEIDHASLGPLKSPLVLFPEGHARSTSGACESLVREKFHRLAALGVSDTEGLWRRVTNLSEKDPTEVASLYAFSIRGAP